MLAIAARSNILILLRHALYMKEQIKIPMNSKPLNNCLLTNGEKAIMEL
jgi:hypothetical protein